MKKIKISILMAVFKERKTLLKILSLAVASFSIAILTVFIPELITLKPSQSPADAVKYITTQPILGMPIPFYINGRTPRLEDIKYFLHGIPFPLHLYFGSPFRSGGSGIIFWRLFVGFLILFIPLLTILILRLKFQRKTYVYKIGIKESLKRIAFVFVLSLTFVISTAFAYPRTFYRADLLGKYDYINPGFPVQFISVYVKTRYAEISLPFTSKNHPGRAYPQKMLL